MTQFDERSQRIGRAVFRVMLSGIFLVASINHLVRPEEVTQKLLKAPLAWLATWVAPPEFLAIAAGIGLLVGGLALLLGFQTRWAALLLIVLLIPITLTVQVGQAETIGPLFKNIGLAGGLLFFLTHGADVFSLDALFTRRPVSRRLARHAESNKQPMSSSAGEVTSNPYRP